MKKINDVDVDNKSILVRVDINLPYNKELGKFEPGPRIKKHSSTIKELADKGAKVVILSHQGRKGEDDFKGLKEHKKILEDLIGKEINFCENHTGTETENMIKEMKKGEVLLLENIRFLDEEIEKPFAAKFVEKLSPLFDYFVLDALSVAHREHASVVGFSKYVPGYMGNILRQEIDALERLDTNEKVTFVIGGSKLKDSIKIMENWLTKGRIDKILVGGVMGILFLKAKGKSIGVSNEEYLTSVDGDKYLEKAKELLDKYSLQILVPIDVAVNKHQHRDEHDVNELINDLISDIGKRTIEEYKKIIEHSKLIVLNGPMGIYEMKEFELGTKEILISIEQSKGFSILGGGHTISAIEKFEIKEDNFGYISLSGKAFLRYLSGEHLPGLLALKNSSGSS